MPHVPRVLLVDGPPETRDVLRAVFQPRGISVDRIRSDADHGAADHGAADPAAEVLVLHEGPTDPADRRHRVVVGRAELGASQSLTQPFEYGELVRAIESLLDDRPAA